MGQKYKPKKPKASRKCNRIRGVLSNQNRIKNQTLLDDVVSEDTTPVLQSLPRELQPRPDPPSSTSSVSSSTDAALQSNALADIANRKKQILLDDKVSGEITPVWHSSPRELQPRPDPQSSKSSVSTNAASQSNVLADVTNRDETTGNYVSPHTFEDEETTYEAVERLGRCIKELEQQLKSTQEENEEVVLKIYGNRIVNLEHFFRQLQNLNHHDTILGCNIESMVIVGEKKEGLASKFTFLCKVCNKRFVLTNLDFEDKNTVPINHCAVAGSLAIGAGISQLRELCASMDLPVMSKSLYKNTHDSLSNVWKETAFDVMAQSAKEEYELAIKHGNKTVDGIPVIEVVIDGCWSKRSYRTNYNALSGCASFVGKRTGKVLYIGIKNKYCTICARADKLKIIPKDHICYKNFDGPSTAMEAAIILEGFKNSIQMYRLIYGTIVSDGDSSTYSKILENRPYANFTVEKVFCRNHLLRNMCTKLNALTTDRKYKISDRKLIGKIRILSIRKQILKAIHVSTSIKTLYEDIVQSANHGFGNHADCRPNTCDKSGENDGSVPKEFFSSIIWRDIKTVISSVAAHARSLLRDVDNNVVERFNSIVAKFVGGKRVNFSLKGSYETRCLASVVSFNTRKPLTSLYKTLLGKSPNTSIKKFEETRRKTVDNQKKYHRKKCRTKQQARTDTHYGENCVQPEMQKDVLEMAKQTFLKNLEKSAEERNRISKDTILQNECSEWLELRRNMLTASIFGKVIKRQDISCHNFVKNLLYCSKSLENVASIKHGKSNEKIAIEQLAGQLKRDISPCGLFIDAHIPFLGATPDGICGQDLVEVKCPISAFKTGLEDAVKQRKIKFYNINKNGSLEINKDSEWYYQVQGQLHITGFSTCIFGVWTGVDKELKIEFIERDDMFWQEKMADKLQSFYIDCVLPELVDPMYPNGKKIRDPPRILEAIQRKELEKTKREMKRKPQSENLALCETPKKRRKIISRQLK